MKRETLAWIAIAAFVLALIGLGTMLDTAGNANASTDCTFRNPQLCDPSRVYYCPDTGGFVSAFSGWCGSLTNGPYYPGGRQPDGELPGENSNDPEEGE